MCVVRVVAAVLYLGGWWRVSPTHTPCHKSTPRPIPPFFLPLPPFFPGNSNTPEIPRRICNWCREKRFAPKKVFFFSRRGHQADSNWMKGITHTTSYTGTQQTYSDGPATIFFMFFFIKTIARAQDRPEGTSPLFLFSTVHSVKPTPDDMVVCSCGGQLLLWLPFFLSHRGRRPLQLSTPVFQAKLHFEVDEELPINFQYVREIPQKQRKGDIPPFFFLLRNETAKEMVLNTNSIDTRKREL